MRKASEYALQLPRNLSIPPKGNPRELDCAYNTQRTYQLQLEIPHII